MKTSKKGIDFITAREGFRLKPYKDSKGLWTVGVGHLLTETELHTGLIHHPDFDLSNKDWRKLTEIDVKNLLRYDLTRFENSVGYNLPNIKQNEFDALVSFSFNVGVGAFESSTLVKYVKLGLDIASIEKQFLRWAHPPELLGRRKLEVKLYKKGIYV